MFSELRVVHVAVVTGGLAVALGLLLTLRSTEDVERVTDDAADAAASLALDDAAAAGQRAQWVEDTTAVRALDLVVLELAVWVEAVDRLRALLVLNTAATNAVQQAEPGELALLLDKAVSNAANGAQGTQGVEDTATIGVLNLVVLEVVLGTVAICAVAVSAIAAGATTVRAKASVLGLLVASLNLVSSATDAVEKVQARKTSLLVGIPVLVLNLVGRQALTITTTIALNALPLAKAILVLVVVQLIRVDLLVIRILIARKNRVRFAYERSMFIDLQDSTEGLTRGCKTLWINGRLAVDLVALLWAFLSALRSLLVQERLAVLNALSLAVIGLIVIIVLLRTALLLLLRTVLAQLALIGLRITLPTPVIIVVVALRSVASVTPRGPVATVFEAWVATSAVVATVPVVIIAVVHGCIDDVADGLAEVATRSTSSGPALLCTLAKGWKGIGDASNANGGCDDGSGVHTEGI